MSEEKQSREAIVRAMGNPGRPEGEAGADMLARMNDHHGPLTAWGMTFWQLNPGDRVLDIGCGGGAALRRMAQFVTEGHLTGLDYSPVAVEQSRRFNADLIARGRVDVIPGNVEALPFPDGALDKVLTVESFYFWPRPLEDLKEVRRVLKKGGRLLLIVNLHNHPGLDQKARDNAELLQLYLPTAKEYRQLLLDAGFAQAEIHTLPGTNRLCALGTK